ncbi:hypothetical protein T4B_14328 [Trichinella pseudospiralis]|uniref:Uncharacterized protein n=1 Tax=Trichinella pseudospiralis TaxID=6337 RepID=A0A0V1JFB5_TRIPS|nr:hypothetical protein T4B_14328 [Trichinella pseudospiralis]
MDLTMTDACQLYKLVEILLLLSEHIAFNCSSNTNYNRLNRLLRRKQQRRSRKSAQGKTMTDG